MIKISLTGLAQYIAGSPAPQRKLLQDFKYPAADEPFAKIKYYREATDCLRGLIKTGESKEWLRQQSIALAAPRPDQTPNSARRLQQNARAVLLYDNYFVGKTFELVECPRFRLTYSNVSISVVPHLFVREGTKTKLIKLQFGGPALPEASVKVITQCLFEGAKAYGLDLRPSSAIYLDLARNKAHHARPGKRTLNEIVAACATISQIWDKIPPPAPSKRKAAA
jgi:hypothetical protein